MSSISYQQAGVDPEKAAKILSDFAGFVRTRPRDPALLSGIGPFASCYSIKDLVNRFEDPVLVTCCDGVGTKAMLACQWDTLGGLGADLVAMNVNDLLCVGATPLLFLDYYACGELGAEQLTTLLKSIQLACEDAGCTLAGGETAEMPGLYREREFDLAGFSVGMVDRAQVLGAERVQVGDVIVALGSSGLHSNGYSLVRKLVEKAGVKPDDKAPFSDSTWKSVLLAPTTIYVSALKPWLPRLHALAHLTGGGLFENLPRVLPKGVRASIGAWEFPPLFKWLQETSNLSTAQMLSTFNCGVGMCAICPSDVAPQLVQQMAAQAIPAWISGRIESGAQSTAPAEVIWK